MKQIQIDIFKNKCYFNENSLWTNNNNNENTDFIKLSIEVKLWIITRKKKKFIR